MKSLLIVLAVLVLLVISCKMVRGAEERVINLPQDSAKWYVSVIGDGPEYKSVLAAFDATDAMKKLKAQVHFLPVQSGTAVYRDRYAKDQGEFAITALPCVRMQTDKGVVVYQACGKQIPSDPSALYAEIASSVEQVSRRVLLPWRRKHNAEPQPEPIPEPMPIDEPPAPIGPPVLEPQQPDFPLWPAMLCMALFLAGLMIGQAEKLKEAQAAKKNSQ